MFGSAYIAYEAMHERLKGDSKNTNHSQIKSSNSDIFKYDSQKYYNDGQRIFPELTFDEFNEIKKICTEEQQ